MFSKMFKKIKKAQMNKFVIGMIILAIVIVLIVLLIRGQGEGQGGLLSSILGLGV